MYKPRSFTWIFAGGALLASACQDQDIAAPELMGRPQFAFPASHVESRLTNAPNQQERPQVEGDIIVYEDSRHGNREIYLYDASTGVERRITNHPGSQERPSIEGRRIVWQDNRHGNFDIYMLDLDTNVEQRLTTNTADQLNPDIDGNRVVWQDLRSGSQAYMLELGGTERFIGASDDYSESGVYISGDWVVWTGGTMGDANVRARNVATNELRDIELGRYNAFSGGIEYPWIAYDDASGGAWHPTAYNLVTGEYVELPNTGQAQADIGGDVMVYRIDLNGAMSIRAYDLSDRQQYVVATVASFQFSPATDGNRIVWQDGRHGPYEIYHYGPPLVIPNRAPVAAVQLVGGSPRSEASNVSFTSNGTADPDADALTYSWNFGDGSPAESGPASTHANMSHVYPDNGSYTITLTVTDPDGLTNSASVTLSVTNVNPTATFVAPSSVVAGSTFEISLTNPADVSPTDVAAGFRYAFDCGSNIFNTISTTASRTCTIAPNTFNILVRARVYDKDNAHTEYTAIVAVANQVPTATFNAPAQIDEGSAITLSLTNVVDSPDQLSTMRYFFDCGAGYGPALSTPTFTCPVTTDNGTVNVRGQVRDTRNGFTDYTASVQVVNVAPTATLGAPASVIEGGNVSLSLTAATDVSSVDAASLQFSFECNGVASGFGSSPNATCPATDGPAEMIVRGRVRDKDGGVRAYEATVNVQNSAPNAQGITAPPSVVEGDVIPFSLVAPTDVPADAGSLQFAFACNGGGYGAFSASNAGACPAVDGPQSVSLRAKVRDKDGAEREFTGSSSVTNVAPTVEAGLGGSVMAGVPFTLRGSFGDAGAADGTWQWTINWGDGATSNGAANSIGDVQSAHAYSAAGSYTARLTVTDKDGASSSDVVQITVTPAIVGVQIDIKPGSSENPIKLNDNSNAKIPVAILSTNGLNVQDIDPATVTLGNGIGSETSAVRNPKGKIQFSYEDVDRNGEMDLVLHFERSELMAAGDLNASTQQLTLLGKLADGRAIRGTDVVRVIR